MSAYPELRFITACPPPSILRGQETEALEYLNKARALHVPKEEAVKAVVNYDLERLATGQRRWKQRSEDYWRRFLAPEN